MRRIPDKAVSVIISVFSAFLLVGAGVLASSVAYLLPDDKIMMRSMVASLAMLLPFVVYYVFIGKRIAPRKRIVLRYNPAVLVFSAYFMSIAGNMILSLMGIDFPHEDVFGDDFTANLFIAFHAVVIAPLTEEFAFRKVLPIVLKPLGVHMSAVIASLMFAVLHEPSTFLHAFIFGLVFYYVASSVGIRASMVIHAALNLFSCIMVLLESVMPTYAFVVLSGIFVILIISIGIACTAFIIADLLRWRVKKSHEYFMRAALRRARTAAKHGEVPVGAVIVCDGKIIAGGRNRRETAKCALCHAEISAIQSASKKLSGWRLFMCDLYVTLEPCPMCAGAIVNSRIRNVYIGARDPKAGSFGSVVNFNDLPYNHKPQIYYGICEKECSGILSDFFAKLREKKKNNKLKSIQVNSDEQ